MRAIRVELRRGRRGLLGRDVGEAAVAIGYLVVGSERHLALVLVHVGGVADVDIFGAEPHAVLRL